MANISETITRICDDLSRPEDTDFVDLVQREILSAISFYDSMRFVFNERILVYTLTQTNMYSYATIIAGANAVAGNTELEDIWAIDDIKVIQGGREYTLLAENWSTLFAANSLAVSANLPDFWATYNKQLRLYPTPNTNVVAQIPAHIKLTTLLSMAGTPTTNAWLTDGEELIRNRATYMVLVKKLDDMEKGKIYKSLTDESLKGLLADAAVMQSTGILSANF